MPHTPFQHVSFWNGSPERPRPPRGRAAAPRPPHTPGAIPYAHMGVFNAYTQFV